jgi:hypothetical protein
VAVSTRIGIVSCPPGEAPLSVRLVWVGVELPLASGRITKDPAAAAWWREHCGLLDGKRQFLFPTASCQERP